MPERDIRKALKQRVEANGGEIRAVSWLGRKHAPDVLCLFPEGAYRGRSAHFFVETKAPGGTPTQGQEREHERLRNAACVVLVISTLGQLDEWLPLP
jgi:hypothetical protein